MKITISNHFHNTSTTLNAEIGAVLTKSQSGRAWRALCGMNGCECGGLLQGDKSLDDHGLGCDDDRNYFVAW